MRKFSNQFVCRLCLTVFDMNNYAVNLYEPKNKSRRNMLQLCVPETDLKLSSDAFGCKDCLSLLEEMYCFKTKCLQTEEKLRCYLENSIPQAINLRHVVECVSSCQEPITSEICRACLSISDNFISLPENDSDFGYLFIKNMLATCVPEMDLNLSTAPAICCFCEDLIKKCYSFKTKCLETEHEIQLFKESTNANSNIRLIDILYKIDANIELEDLKPNIITHLKQEFNAGEMEDQIMQAENDSVKKVVDLKSFIKTEVVQEMTIKKECLARAITETSPQNKIQVKVESGECMNVNVEEDDGDMGINTIAMEEIHLKTEITIEEEPVDSSLDEIGKSRKAEVGSADQLPARLQMLTQQAMNPLGEGMKWHTCEVCSYETKWKQHLERHKQIHTSDSNQLKTYRCSACTYVTRYKHSLSRHYTLEHGSWYKCELCEYQTKWKRCHNQHILSHKGGVIWFKCELCEYQTKWKYHLKRHMFKHK